MQINPAGAVALARPVGRGMLVNSVPTAPTVKPAAAKNEQNDEDDQKRSGIHRSLLKEIDRTLRGPNFQGSGSVYLT
jgi:hypothetical protein